MGSIFLLYRNILEQYTVGVTNEDASYPKWRLHDRDVGKLFKGTGTADHTIAIDPGGSAPGPDTLIIPSGHNLYGGAQLSWEVWDGMDWDYLVTPWAGAAGQIVKEAVGAPPTGEGWILLMTSLAAIPEIPELWMGEKVELADVVTWGYQDGPRGNVERIEALSGRPYMLKRGEERQYRNYSCKLYDAAARTALETFFSHSREKPFWLKDLDGSWYFMSLLDPNIGPMGRPGLNRYDIALEMIEVLA